MRDPARIDRITQKLASIWAFYPDWRFFQTLHNYFGNGDDGKNYFMEDDKVEARLDEILKGL